MVISDLPILKGGRYSWAISMGLSLLSSKLAAKMVPKAATGWMLLTGVMYLPHNQMAKAITETLLAYMIHPHQQAVQIVTKKVGIKHLAKAPAADTGVIYKRKLNLHSFKKDYVCHFTGKVTCGTGTCQAASVQVHIASKENPRGIYKTATMQSDGSYEVSVLVSEFLHENVDWWIVADSPDSAAKQVQGRQILMDDSRITIEEPIELL